MTVWSTWGRRLVALPGVSAFGTFLGLGSGVLTFLQTPSSANLAAALTDETGTGTVVFSSAIREKLAANRTYYVRTDGSDSNTGLVDSAGGAFLTLQKAVNVVAALDIDIYNVTIQVRDGTYTAGLSVSGSWVGSGTVLLVGNTGTPGNCVISTTSANCITISNYGRLTVSGGFKIQTTTSGIGCAAASGGVLTITGAMEYGACATAQIYAERNGIVVSSANYTINGNSPRHLQALSGGYILTSGTVTLTGTPAYSGEFARGERMALLESVCTYSGAATGTRYAALTGGGINTFGGGANFFPGNVAGAATAPGWYA
jgi:hypothetical protein